MNFTRPRTIPSQAPSRSGLDGRSRYHGAAIACAALGVAMILTHTSESRATSLLIDQVPSGGGTLSYDGAGGPLVGTDIVFQQISGDGTPLNDGSTLTLVDGRLNFSTGANLAEPSPIYGWGGGGSFVLTADAVLDSALVDIIVPADDTVILTGTFVGDPSFAAIGIVGFNQILISAFGLDEKHPDILTYFGLSPNEFRFAHSDISATDLVIDPGTQGFSATVAEADIVNTLVPEPSTLVLAAFSLVAVAAVGWRRRKTNLEQTVDAVSAA
jgi:hypothetical protein